MQCVNCHFQNMPGVDVCGRCGSSLRLATAVIDVHPPRARPWQKRLRRLWPGRPLSAQTRDAGAVLRERVLVAAGDWRVPLPPGPVLIRLLAPGWAHFSLGQFRRGRWFLGVYLALLLLGLFFWGTFPGSLLLGLAFSTHASAVLDVLFQCPGTYASRCASWLVTAATLGLLVYAPVYALLTRVVDVRIMAQSLPPFEGGDVVLVNHWAYWRSLPQIGDLVLFREPARTLPAIVQGHGNYNVLFRETETVDRVLAGPGAIVDWIRGQLYVEGEPAPYQPLNQEPITEDFSVSVPAGNYFILPTVVNVHGQGRLSAEAWKQLGCVPRSNIAGKITLRTHPLRRFGEIR